MPEIEIRPPLYHVRVNGTLYPIELVNHKWHYIEWDDLDKYKRYWVWPKKEFKQGDLGLGWVGKPMEAKTPTMLYQVREGADTSSTQPEEPDIIQDNNKEDPMDKDLKQIEELAKDLYGWSTLFGTVEELDPEEDRTHHLPTYLPSVNVTQPVSLNPIRARFTHTTPEETIIATVDTTKLITNTIKLDRSLKRKVPKAFNEDWTKTQKFMNTFNLF
jgi:hypothetical protein